MAWLYKRGKRWWIGYRINDRQFLKPTGKTDQAQAQKVLDTFNMMELASRTDRLNEDFFKSLTGKALPVVTLKAALDDWLAECKRATGPNTFERYEDIAQQFQAFLKADDKHPQLRDVTTAHATAFLNALGKKLAPSSVNLARKVLSTFFNRAVANGQTDANPMRSTKATPIRRKNRVRRAFKVTEVQTMLAAATSPFWRYMLLGGLYTGLRLGDLVCLRRDEIDTRAGVLRLITGKTDDTVEIPLYPALRDAIAKRLAEIPKGVEYLWPEQAALYQKDGSGPFSNGFYKLVLHKCGLVPKRTHKKKKDGRDARRQLNEVSFHSLRHTFVSLLKLSGASQSVAKALAGHTSDLISDLYTHVAPDQMRGAIAALPEVASS